MISRREFLRAAVRLAPAPRTRERRRGPSTRRISWAAALVLL